MTDKEEADKGTDPKKADTDGDGLTDKEEADKGTDPKKADTDGDGFTDKEEVAKGTDPKDPNSKPEDPATADTKAPAKPEIKTDLTDKAGTKTPVEVTAEPGSKVELFDKDGNKLGEGVADENGKATITPTKELPAGDVTAKATDPAGNVSEASTPAKATPTTEVKVPEKTPVNDPSNLTDAEKEKVKEAVKKANPAAKEVDVGKDGTVTVTLPDGTKATIPGSKAVEEAPKGVKAPEKTPVKDPSNLTDAEKEKVKEAVKKANPTAKEVEVGKDGTVMVTFPDGTKATIPGSKAVAKAKDSEGIKAPSVTVVKDLSRLTDAEKEAVKQALIAANPKLKDAEIIIADNGEATIVYPDGQVVVIPASDLVEAKAANNGSNGSNGNAGTDTTNGNSNAQDTNAKLGQRLANTGTTETNTGLAGLGLGTLGGLLAAARRRRNDKN